MPDLLYEDQIRPSPATAFRPRDASPDSVIFTLESNFSLFSSASASVDRCSFTSDAHDRDSLASEISLHLAGHEESDEHESSSGPDRNPDPNKLVTVHKASKRGQGHGQTRSARARAEKSNAQREDSRGATSTTATSVEDDIHHSDSNSARNSFSLALKECQDRRSRSEAAVKKSDRRRPASLDLNNVVSSSSPRLGNIKKTSNSTTRRSGAFPSPGTPNYRIGMQKGWSSERVPLHANGSNRRHSGNNGNNASMLPFHNGRALPSKWEDAERWIFSPVAGDSMVRSSIPAPQKRPKSKSGPLGPPGIAYYSLYSPAVHVFDGGNMGNFIAGSPFSAGVLAADGLANIRSNGNNLAFPVRTEPCMARSVSVHGCSEVVAQYSQNGKIDELKDDATDISRAVSRRDMATQMSPEGSNHSSPSRRGSFTISTNSALPSMEIQSLHSTKSEIRDVQVDERVTMTRWSKKHKSRNNGKSSEIVDDWRKRSIGARSSAWDVSEATKSISRAKREEAKITAWENLQKAKAEAAIRKLEMKLEKKRSSSMDKIMKKLRSAQKRAQDMRSSVLANDAHQTSTTSHKVKVRVIKAAKVEQCTAEGSHFMDTSLVSLSMKFSEKQKAEEILPLEISDKEQDLTATFMASKSPKSVQQINLVSTHVYQQLKS